MRRNSVPRVRLSLAAGLLLPLLAILAWTPTPASAATDSISAVVQVCTLPVGSFCDPGNAADWAPSATVYGSEVWWQVVVTNAATSTDSLTNISVTSSLPNSGSTPTDCGGPVPVPGNTLAPGASYSYVCQTTNITPPATETQTVTVTGDPPAPASPVTSATSAPAVATVQPNTAPPGASLTAVLQICTASTDSLCDPSTGITDPSWASSSEALYSIPPDLQVARWRVFITNTGTVPLTDLVATDTLAQTDCGGFVPPATGYSGTVAAGASYAFECQTNNVTTTTTNTVTVTAYPSPYPSGAPVTSAPSSATSMSIPTGLATTSDTASSVGLSWNASASGGTGYTVYRNGTAVGTSTTTSYTDSTVTASTTYQYTVDAFNSWNVHSAQSTPALSATTPPNVPTGLATTSDTSSSVGLSWTVPKGGATGYTVYRNGTAVATTAATSYTDSTVSPSTTYQYTVDAFNAEGHSAQSSALSVSTPSPSPGTAPNTTPPHGYWLVGSDGGIFSFGSALFHGSMGGTALQRPVVGIVATPDRGGYWLDASDGGVFSFGDTQFYGSIPGLGLHPAGSGLAHSLNAPIVGMVASHDQGGYFMVASDGGVFAFGDAHFAGSCPSIGGCAGAAVAVMPDASAHGYWLITSTGNVYAFGDAPYFGAPGHGTVTSAVATPDGKGYWILLGDGEVFSYGDAAELGSPSSANFSAADPAAAIFATSDGAGYWVASALGAVYNLGDAPNDGGMAGTHLNGSIIAASGS